MRINRIISFFKYFIICLVLLFVLILGGVNLPFVQKIISEKANRVFIDKKLPVHVEKVKILITGRLWLSGVKILENPGDTIVYAGNIKISVKLLPVIFHKLKIMGITVDNATINIATDKSSGKLNIISIFSPGNKPAAPESSRGKKWDITVGSVYLSNVRFNLDDSINGIRICQTVKELTVTFEKFSLADKQISVSYISLKDSEGGISLEVSPKASSDTTVSKKPWTFSLKNSDIKRIHFTFDQPDNKQKMDFHINSGMIYNAAVDLGKHKIRVSKIDLGGPVAQILITPVFSEEPEPVVKPGTSSTGFPGEWDISGEELKIAGGTFQSGPYTLTDRGQSADSGFIVTSVNSKFSNVRLNSGTAQLNLDDLSFSLANGFRLDEGQIVFFSDSTRKTTLKSTLKTSESHISLLLESEFGINDLLKSYSSAPFSIKIIDAGFSARDFLLFLPDMTKKLSLKDKSNITFGLKCDISGKPDMLKIKSIDLATSNGASVSLSGNIEGITHPSSAKYSISFRTGPITPAHLSELLKFTSSEKNIPDFDPVTVEGSVDSTFTKPRFHIALQSNSGRAIINGDINLDEKSYNLKVSGSHIDLGNITGIKDLGIFTGIIDLSGNDFTPAKMKIAALLEIDSVGYKGYIYNNIRADLSGDKGSFKYSLKAEDPSFKCDLTGTLILSDSLTGGQIKGMLALDAGKVNLYKDASVSGNLEAGLSKTSEGLSGFASVKEMTLKKNNNSQFLKSLDMSFSSSETLVKGQISSDFLKADGYYSGSVADFRKVLREGRFKSFALIDSAVGNRFPYITLLNSMHLSFESSYHPLIGLLVSDTIFSYNKVILNIDKDSSGMAKAEMVVDRFNIGKSRGFNALVNLARYKERSELKINADSLQFGNISLTDLSAGVKSGADTAKVSLKARDRGKNPLFDIEGKMYKTGDEITMTTSREEWVINGYTWKVNSGDLLVVHPRDKEVQVDLHLKNELSTIDIYGSRSEKITFDFNKLGLEMLLIPGMSNLGYGGEFTGSIDYIGGIKTEIAGRLEIDKMKIKDDQIGDMKISGRYQADTLGNIESSINAEMNDTSLLKLNLKFGKNSDQRTLNAEFSNLPLIIIGSLSAKYLSDLQGTLGGRIELKPVNGKPMIEGEIRVNDIGLKLIPVSARFYMPGDVIKITDNKLLFNNFTVLDSLRDKLDLNGSINFSDPRNIIADLQVTSTRIQVMNTTPKDNPEFNGSIFVDSRINLTGQMQKPSVQGSIVLAEGTVINYRYTETLAVSETQKLVTFASLTEDTLQEEKKKTEINRISKTPDIEASIEIKPNTLFNFEISKGYDIGVHITGGGFLTYSMMPGKEIDLTGVYEIRQGSSELKIPGWPRKDLIITPGSNVKWDGQVDDPDLRIETTSNVRGSYVNPIDQKNREVNFIVYMKLSGRLSQIDIMFDVRSEDQYLTSVFNTMSTDERMRQAVNLLIFGSVQLPNAGGSSDYLTQQINQFWESQINSFTKSAVKFVDFSLGIDSYKDPAKAGADRTSVSYQVKKDLFKDRGSVMVSGRMNDNDPSSQQSTAVIENFIFEYALDSGRTNYLKVYRQQNYEDLLEGEVIKSGVGYIYRKNYDRVSDIWRKQRKPKEKK